MMEYMGVRILTRFIFNQLIFLFFAVGVMSSAKAQSFIRIVTPSQNTSLIPGATVVVNVSGSNDIDSVYVKIGDFSLSGSADRKPFSVELRIPSTYQGHFTISAIGIRRDGSSIVANPIGVEVAEGASPAGKIVSAIGSLTLSYPGDRTYFPFEFKLDNGTTKSLGVDKFLIRIIPDGAVAVVGDEIVGLASGEASLQVSYGNSTASLPILVKSVKRGDLNGDGSINLGDLAAFQALPINIRSVGVNDARDLNGDGRIDALDLRVLTTLCTRPRCAVQ